MVGNAPPDDESWEERDALGRGNSSSIHQAQNEGVISKLFIVSSSSFSFINC